MKQFLCPRSRSSSPAAGSKNDEHEDEITPFLPPQTTGSSAPEKVQMYYQTRPCTRFFVFLKEASLIYTLIISAMFFGFVYVPEDYQPLSTEWRRQEVILLSNQNTFAPLAKGDAEELILAGGASAQGKAAAQQSLLQSVMQGRAALTAVTPSRSNLQEELPTSSQLQPFEFLSRTTWSTGRRSAAAEESGPQTQSLLQFLKKRRLQEGENSENHLVVDYFTGPSRTADLSASLSVLLPRDKNKDQFQFKDNGKEDALVDISTVSQYNFSVQDFKYVERQEAITKAVDESIFAGTGRLSAFIV